MSVGTGTLRQPRCGKIVADGITIAVVRKVSIAAKRCQECTKGFGVTAGVFGAFSHQSSAAIGATRCSNTPAMTTAGIDLP